jgi:hypothetical protein
MTPIWQNDGTAWQLLSPAGFPDEAALHRLVEDAPHTLPLAGSPGLVMLGREVFLGRNRADLIAMEHSGRLVVIEIKLAYNAEARQAVIAQILTYAAYLRGLGVTTLERDVLGPHLRQRNYESLAHAAEVNDQEGAYDPDSFSEELARSLAQGRFRLVIVLDRAPEELSRLVGYLEAVADKLVIDLITVSAYRIGDTQIIVPQRVDPERQESAPSAPTESQPAPSGRYVEGAVDFEATIQQASVDQQSLLRRMLQWAVNLEQDGIARVGTYHGKAGVVTLLPRIPTDGVGMVTVYNSPGGAYLQFHRGVIERRAPQTLHRIEVAAAPAKVGRGSTTWTVSDDLLSALTSAYREAASGRIALSPSTETPNAIPELGPNEDRLEQSMSPLKDSQ